MTRYNIAEGLPRPERDKETEPREEEDASIHVNGV